MVLEVHLHDFVAKAEHDGVACSHPLLDIDRAWLWSVLRRKLVLLGMLV